MYLVISPSRCKDKYTCLGISFVIYTVVGRIPSAMTCIFLMNSLLIIHSILIFKEAIKFISISKTLIQESLMYKCLSTR